MSPISRSMCRICKIRGDYSVKMEVRSIGSFASLFALDDTGLLRAFDTGLEAGVGGTGGDGGGGVSDSSREVIVVRSDGL